MKKKSRRYSLSVINRIQVDFEDSVKAIESFFLASNIILVDIKLKNNIRPLITSRSKASIYFLEGSEATKSMTILNKLLIKIFSNKKLDLNRKTKLIVIGGGTLGDLGGFLAHILKRGLELVIVPSTWLSAMDSAHGGKNGINFNEIKNQLGTIYNAKQVILIKSLLEQQPIDRKVEGFGELIKIAYIHSPVFFRQVASEKLNRMDLFNYLPLAIEAKYKIVKKDPNETQGIRYLLNFGHTLAHIWEARLGIHHGIAVLLGMYFDFLWADKRGYNVGRDLKIFFDSEVSRGVLSLFYSEALFAISLSQLRMMLSADKKKEDKFIRYIFPHGHSKLKVESVTVSEILEEYQRQKKQVERNREFSVVEV